jgi:hypothetical protein
MDLEMQRRAHAKAAELGISFAEYMRRLVANDLGPSSPNLDISVMFNLVDDGQRTNIARDKDRMIAEAVWKERRRKAGRKRQMRLRVRTDNA